MRNKKSPTIEDVARHAGVSTATVSRCLNSTQHVKTAKRALVEESMRALGYIPHGAAKILATNKSRQIGAVFPRINSILFGKFFGVLQKELDNAGYNLVISTSQYSLESEENTVFQLLSRNIDAVILVGSYHKTETIELLHQNKTPYVLTWAWNSESTDIQIGFSNYDSMTTMMKYVLGLGHDRIGAISGITKYNDRAYDRLRALKDSSSQHGVELDDSRIEEVSFGIEEGARAFSRIMRSPNPPSAVICTSDIFAFGAIREARKMNLRVPEDVTITGFDDTEIASCLAPPLTTIRTPNEAMAKAVAEVLVNHLDNRDSLKSIRLDTELILRDSSAPPKHKKLS